MVNRQAERGAAVFIVVMVLTLLTAVGIFAVRSSSLADVAAGYDREGAQAALVAQYAVTASAAYLANPAISGTLLAAYADTVKNLKANAPQCQSNALPAPIPLGSPSPGCAKLDSNDIQTSVSKTAGAFVFAPTNQSGGPGTTSSLNANETTNAFFVVEITEVAKTGVPSPGSSTSPVMMNITAMAQVRPTDACVNGTTAPAAGQQVMRAMITAESPIATP